MNNLREVSNFLKTQSINISPYNEWLREGCEFFFENNPNGRKEDLHNFVYEQWLLADLHDISERCFPDNLNNIMFTLLSEKYAVQVNEMLDVSESCYSQLKTIHQKESAIPSNENDDDDEEKVKCPTWQPKRSCTLKLSITDGIQNVFGLEFEHINELKERFIPGFKILLIGPLECRRGVILLRNHNVRIFGGEIDSLIELNTSKNILLRKLNTQSIENEVIEVSRANSIEWSAPMNNEFLIRTADLLPTNLVSSRNSSGKKDKTPVGVVCPVVSSKRSAQSPPLKHDLPVKTVKKSEINTAGCLSHITAKCSNLKTVNQLRDLLRKKVCGNFECVASIDAVSPPKVKNNQWNVTVDIADKHAKETVGVCDSFAEEIFGMSAFEVWSQKERMLKNPQIKENIEQMLQLGVTKMMKITGHFHLQITMENDLPLLKNVTPL